MNAIFFGTKRVFHSSLRIMRRPLQYFGLTSARFDMLYALLEKGPYDQGSTPQRDLRETLGVSASVVSRMLQSLERLGLVERCIGEDRRQRDVTLTERGAQCVRRAYHALHKGAQRLVDIALCDEGFRDKNQRFFSMMRLDDALFALRESFGDSAALLYYWGHPDD